MAVGRLSKRVSPRSIHRIKGIKRRVNDLSLNVHEMETFLQDLKSRQKVG